MESKGKPDMKYTDNLHLWYQIKKQAIDEYLIDLEQLQSKLKQKNG